MLDNSCNGFVDYQIILFALVHKKQDTSGMKTLAQITQRQADDECDSSNRGIVSLVLQM